MKPRNMLLSILLFVLFLGIMRNSSLAESKADNQIRALQEFLYLEVDDTLGEGIYQAGGKSLDKSNVEMEVSQEGELEKIDLLSVVDYNQLQNRLELLNIQDNKAYLAELEQKLRESELLPDDFDSVEVTDFDENHVDIKYFKANEIENPYDTLEILLEKKTGKIVYLLRRNDFSLKNLDLEDLKEIMLDETTKKELVEKYVTFGEIEEVKTEVLCFDHENLINNKEKSNVQYEDYFIAYTVTMKDNTKIIIDPISLEEIFVEETENSTSFYDTEPNRYRLERAKYIAIAMGKKGLPGGAVGVRANTTYNKASILYNINKNQNQRGFSFSGHGTSTSMLITHPTDSKKNQSITASNCRTNSRWKFVFIDTCSSEEANTWASVFNIWSSSKGKVLLGWRKRVGYPVSYKFCKSLAFNTSVYSNDSLYKNVLRAKKTVGSEADILNFRGDYNY